MLAFITRLQDELDEEHKAIFGTIIKRTDAVTKDAERGIPMTNSKGELVKLNGEQVYTKDTANALKGLDQLGKLAGLYDKDASKTKDVPQWVGMRIDFGDGKAELVTGTGPLPSKADKSLTKEGPRKTQS